MSRDYIGHLSAVAALRRELPPVGLLIGPPSVGKWTLTRHVAEHHRVGQVDHATYPDGITADAARSIITFVSTAPFGALKLVTARLDNTTDAAYNVLLKTLEEPPPTARFLLTYSGSITGRLTTLPATVASRARVYRLGLLTTDEVRDILIQTGMSPSAATRAAALGRGQVRAAQQAAGADNHRSTALNVIRALALGDRDQYDRAFKGFDDSARQWLLVWFHEAITGQWAAFTEADTFGLRRDPARLRAMLVAVSRLPAASARLGVRVALEPYLTLT